VSLKVVNTPVGPRNLWLDCLRAVAVMMVCAEHFFHLPPMQAVWSKIHNYYKGDLGVWIFYVLSGYLIGGLLAAEKKKTGRVHLGRFYARRITRLYPSYFCFLAILWLVGAEAIQRAQVAWWLFLVPWLDMQGLGIGYLPFHLRTLHIEEKFYLAWGWMAKILQPKVLLGAAVVLLIYGPVARLCVYFPGGPATLMFDSAADCFAIGILLAYGRQKGVFGEDFLQKTMTRWSARPEVLLAGIVVVGGLRTVKPFSYFLVPFLPTMVALLTAGMMLSGWAKKSVLQTGWMAKVGIMSYTIYLFQQLVLCPWNEVYSWQFTWGRWIACTLLCAGFVWVWFHRVEAPLTLWGKRRFHV